MHGLRRAEFRAARFCGYAFEHVGPIEPEGDSGGAVRELNLSPGISTLMHFLSTVTVLAHSVGSLSRAVFTG